MIFLPDLGMAQLTLKSIKSNPAYSKDLLLENSSQQKTFQDTVELPFIDDFSYNGPYPWGNFWLDSTAYINAHLPILPPSWGVATLDGLNKFGRPYAGNNAQGSADTLTSRWINLNYPASDSIYLSFMYQPKGLGNFPEFADTFSLEFKNPDDTLWTYQWSVRGQDFPQASVPFKSVMIPITDTAFLKKGFQFRFRNYASLNGNLDHWHIDYVRLDRGRFRNDTLYDDVAFVYKPFSILKTYQSVPFQHFLPGANTNMAETYDLSLTQNRGGAATRFYNYYIINSAGEIKDSINLSPKGPVTLRNEYVFEEVVKYVYEDNNEEWTTYQLKHWLRRDTSVSDLIARNDTTTYLQILSNYYALDDGTPEANISLSNPTGGFVAQRFDIWRSDTLKSVQFYIDELNDGLPDKPFFIMVWAAGNNQPGQIVVSEGLVYPDHYGRGYFTTYVLENPVYLTAGTYYFGWAQTENFDLNVGFDLNINHNDKIFYNFDGNWYNFQSDEGTIMIRPMFKFPNDIYVGQHNFKHESTRVFNVFPNPFNDKLTIQLPTNESNGLPISISTDLTDISGRVLKQFSWDQRSEYRLEELSNLSDGMYFLKHTYNGKAVGFNRIIKQTK